MSEVLKEDPWAGFNLVHTYTRQQAISDGVLIDLSSSFPNETRMFKWNVCCKPLSTEGSEVLRSRLGLNGYRCETVALPQAVIVSSGQADKVIFAKSISTDDRVFLHVQVTNDAGKRSIISSLKKISTVEWNQIANTLAGMNII